LKLEEQKRTEKNRIFLKRNNALESEWLIKKIDLKVSDKVKEVLIDEQNLPEKLKNTDNIELSLATKIGKEGITKLSAHDRLLYSYLPTDETRYSLPVLVNTSFLTTANRETLHANSKWNQWLFKNIAIEIFKWIAELVDSEFEFHAYRLIPDRTIDNELSREFNKGIDEALDTVPFIIASDNSLLKVKDTIIDFTFLSEKGFIGEIPIQNYIDKKISKAIRKFAKNTGFGSAFKKLGAITFEWKDIKSFLISQSFTNYHTIDNNIELIKHLKHLCESDKVQDISAEILKGLPFIWDHKNFIRYPSQVCFPAPDDKNWNNPDSDLNFLHQILQDWLHKEPEMRFWLETLGMIEKTDVTYITQTIIPNIDNYVTIENAIKTKQDLFNLYRKGDLKEDLLKQLSKIKLLTSKGSLRPAKECFLSDFYNPRLNIEEVLEKDIYVSKNYCEKNIDKDEWKRFFRILGVQEGISIRTEDKKQSIKELIKKGYKIEYLEADDKKFKPAYSTFLADSFENISTLSYFQNIENNPELAFLFWQDFIQNFSPENINNPAVAYWGYEGRAGQRSGDEVENYISWSIKNIACIPVMSEECKIASSVFLNTDVIKSISGKYLPVFKGPELSPDWKSFFSFRTKLELIDYLLLLNYISNDINDKGKVKKENFERIQAIYSDLLDQCVNWNSDDISNANEWANTGLLLNTKKQFTKCTNLKYYFDGNESIFQDQFDFLTLNSKNDKHSNLPNFLSVFKITILKQSDFKLDHTKVEECSSLTRHLETIIPYFKIWIENEANDDKTKESLDKLHSKVEKLNIYQAEELKIKYEDIDFTKRVNVHFNEANLFVTKPWDTNSVLLKLPEVLCRYFYLLGYDKKLDFLLRSNIEEIQTYFIQEKINIPEDLSVIRSGGEISQEQVPEQNIHSIAGFENGIDEGRVPLEEFFYTSISDYKRLRHAEKIVLRAVYNVLKYLKEFPDYNCTHAFQIASSIIGGITKNGNEITIVARPSDGGEVLPYYTSEFDVLEYVDAEFWCEDGINAPLQITLGQLLKKTGINRIPINTIELSNSELETLVFNPKSKVFDYNAVPFAPQKIAKIISSFANTTGGTLIFGIKETSPTSNEIVGLSTDFKVVEIVKKAISLLSPIPSTNYDWLKSGDRSIFIIKTEKADNDIFLENQKFIREGINSILEDKSQEQQTILNIANYKKTVAIIIAIENYKQRDENQISKVKYAQADALKFKNMLIESMNIDEKDIYTFINEDALKNDLEYDLSRLFLFLTEEDRLIFYYVGHGFHNGIENYLSTYDMHPFNISNTAVSLRKILFDPLQKSKCKNALIFIDACAKTFQDENERSQITDINDEEILLLNNEYPYYATFLSCLPGQSSFSSDILKNGIWTYHLVKAISGKVSEVIKNNKYVTDTLLKDYLSVSVSKYAKDEFGFDQNPKAILDSSCENVIVEIVQQ